MIVMIRMMCKLSLQASIYAMTSYVHVNIDFHNDDNYFDDYGCDS